MNAHPIPSTPLRWGPTSVAIAVSMVAILILYSDTALAMFALWGASETFAHGYIVPFISAWLVWRRRKDLAALTPHLAPTPAVLLLIAAIAAVWLVGDLASVNPVMQFALVAWLALTVPALAGWAVTRVIFFPLAFLFFAVPFGDFLLPWLMARTADFTVIALRASGIPVYRDGLQFVIPSGTWSVVEACSGVRYLIASLMVGALFAYLNYRTTRKRVLFMLVALAVPIVANWLRAYTIVMIGHLSSNTLAVGVDHLIYGWLFFGVVIGLMFFIGARWSEGPAEPAPAMLLQPRANGRVAAQGLWAATAGLWVVIALPLIVERALTAGEDRSAPVLAAPGGALEVAGAGPELPLWTPAFRNPSAMIERRYAVGGRPVGLYVGYYRGQGPDRKLVSSINALVRVGDAAWAEADVSAREILIDGRQLAFKTARIGRPAGSNDPTRLVAWQSYWIDGRFVAGDARAKLWGAWQRLRGRGDDGAVVIVYAQERERGDADELLVKFLREQFNAIEIQLKKARHGD